MREKELLIGHSGKMLIILSIGLAIVRLGRRMLPPLLPTIISDLSITPFQAGIALSIAAITVAILQFPSGRLSDELTRKTIILSGLTIPIFGAIVLYNSITYYLFICGVMLLGVGEGLYGAAERGLVSDLFVERRGTAFGFNTMFSDVGGILAAGLAAGALTFGTWRSAFIPAIIGLFFLAILIASWGHESVVIKPVSLEIRKTMGRLLYQREYQWILVAYSLFSATVQGVIGFLPSLLQADHEFSPELASTVFAGMFIIGLLARPLSGHLSDSRHRLRIAGTGLIVGALGLVILIIANSQIIAVAGILVFSSGQMAFPPTAQAYLMDRFPDESMGGDLGAIRALYIGVGSIGPTYVGYVSNLSSYTAAFIGFVVALFAGGIIILALPGE